MSIIEVFNKPAHSTQLVLGRRHLAHANDGGNLSRSFSFDAALQRSVCGLASADGNQAAAMRLLLVRSLLKRNTLKESKEY